MVKLTEEMVAARTRISDLSMVKKLNCWGADLTDVSLIGAMPNVEVLALSVNQIKTLSHFKNCARLQELYVRKNNINDLREVCYLKNLSSLKNLWLADNPCAEVEGYRHTVLRALPNLKKLDDVAITSEEIREATRLGGTLSLPGPEEINENPKSAVISDPPQQVAAPPKERSPTKNADAKVPTQVPQPRKKSIVSPASTPTSITTASPVHTPTTPARSPTPTLTPTEDVTETASATTCPLSADEVATTHSPINDSPKRRFSTMSASHSFQEKPVAHSESAPSSRRSSLAVSPYPTLTEHATSAYSMNNSSSMEQIGSRCPVHHATYPPPNGGSQEALPAEHPGFSSIPAAPVSAMQPPYMQHHTDHPHATPSNYFAEHRGYRPAHDMHPARTPSLRDCYVPSAYSQQQFLGQNTERVSPTRSSSSARIRNRASNLLMATLCLVNELDFSSLEVLSVAVRNRLEEFDD